MKEKFIALTVGVIVPVAFGSAGNLGKKQTLKAKGKSDSMVIPIAYRGFE